MYLVYYTIIMKCFSMCSVGTPFWSPNPYRVKSWSKKAQHNEFSRVWVKELGLDKLDRCLHGIKVHIDRNKRHYVERCHSPKRFKTQFMYTNQYIRVSLHAAVFYLFFFRPFLMGVSIHYIGHSLSSRLYTCW